eukprot:8360976-Alexandrium_andersonii.AAC.1
MYRQDSPFTSRRSVRSRPNKLRPLQEGQDWKGRGAQPRTVADHAFLSSQDLELGNIWADIGNASTA